MKNKTEFLERFSSINFESDFGKFPEVHTSKAKAESIEKRIFELFNDFRGLRTVYGTWSDEKDKAYLDCLKIKVALEGEYGCITSYSSRFFSYSFLVSLMDEHKTAVVNITKDYVRVYFKE